MKSNFSGHFSPSYVSIPRLKNDADKFPVIAKELNEYSTALKKEFIKVFPSKGKYGVCFVEDIILKGRQVGLTTSTIANTLFVEVVEFSSEEDFWYRWNRFKKLKAFL